MISILPCSEPWSSYSYCEGLNAEKNMVQFGICVITIEEISANQYWYWMYIAVNVASKQYWTWLCQPIGTLGVDEPQYTIKHTLRLKKSKWNNSALLQGNTFCLYAPNMRLSKLTTLLHLPNAEMTKWLCIMEIQNWRTQIQLLPLTCQTI